MNPPQHVILIVDDSLEDRAAYRRYLDSEILSSYKIIEAESGEEGLDQLASETPDLILLDYLLPDFDGLEFLEELKQQLHTVPPTIMLTGQGNEAVAVEAMKKGVKDYLVKNQLNSTVLNASVKGVLQQHHWQSLLNKSLEQQKLIAETSLRVRQSLNLSVTLDTAVKEVQLLFDCDRVVIYRFDPDMSGNVVAESVKSGWRKSLGIKVEDTCFQEQGAEKYERGETLAIDDIYDSQLSDCHIKLLEEFQVKANVVVPMLLEPTSADTPHLWGLLIAHQCDNTRHWETSEVELLDKLSVQLAIAIQQAELIANLKAELNTRSKLEGEIGRLIKVLESSQDYIGLADTQGRVIWNNSQMNQIIGIESDTELDKLTIPDYHPLWATDIIQTEGLPTAIESGSWLGETALLTRQGKEIPVSQMILAHRTANGELDCFSTVMRDLTQQKRNEESLQSRAKELKWANEELLKATFLLKKRNQELDNFAYVTSHDLKAPLRAIANLATWIGEDLEGQIPEENQEQLRLMQSRVERMDNLIKGLLKYSRAGRQSSPIQATNVHQLVQEVVDLLSPHPGLEVVVNPDLPTMDTEALLLQQVFSNLISNAIKYHPHQSGKITVSCQEQPESFEFAVADDGMGIEPQYHERIFTIFQTLQARDSFESTGIGLSIVKKIVEDQGGTIRVESELGLGATFYFTWRKLEAK